MKVVVAASRLLLARTHRPTQAPGSSGSGGGADGGGPVTTGNHDPEWTPGFALLRILATF